MYQRLNDTSYYRKFYFQDSFYAQCRDVGPLTMIQFRRSLEAVKKIMHEPALKDVKHVIATGCGDSNIAAFAVKEAFAHYLPDVEYEAVEAIELSRHYIFPEDGSKTTALFISVSGRIFRTIEALRQCKAHGITTVAVTDSIDSPTAREADIVLYENTPAGDNNAGLRTYYVNVMSTILLAAAMAQSRTGETHLECLQEQVEKYHDRFFEQWDNMDRTCFATAIRWMDKKYFEITADGPLFWAGKFIQAKIIELSGDACTVTDSENYRHVNGFMGPGEAFGELVLLNSHDSNVDNMAAAVHDMVKKGREVLLFADRTPRELGMPESVLYCHVPVPDREWTFLAAVHAWLPGAIFAGFRHTTIGEPMFRGGMDPSIFIPTYYSPIDVIDR